MRRHYNYWQWVVRSDCSNYRVFCITNSRKTLFNLEYLKYKCNVLNGLKFFIYGGGFLKLDEVLDTYMISGSFSDIIIKDLILKSGL